MPRVGSTPGNYGTVKFLLDEAAPGPAQRVGVRVEITHGDLPPSAFAVEVFTNLNRRDHAVVHEPLAQSGSPSS